MNENRIGPKEITFSKTKAVTLEVRMLSSLSHKASVLVPLGSLPSIPFPLWPVMWSHRTQL